MQNRNSASPRPTDNAGAFPQPSRISTCFGEAHLRTANHALSLIVLAFYHGCFDFVSIIHLIPLYYSPPNSILEMRGVRPPAWATGVSTRPVLRAQNVILRDILPLSGRSCAYHRGQTLNSNDRLYSTASETFRGRTGRVTRPADSALTVHQHSLQRIATRSPIISLLRPLSTSSNLSEAKPSVPPSSPSNSAQSNTPFVPEKTAEVAQDEGFELSEKAAQAAQVNFRAKLTKDGASGKKSGFSEIWRLLKIARPEAKALGFAFFFLLISSSITMSIPFSIGKIIDGATKSESEGGGQLFGMSIPTFYTALGGILLLGAAANYGRIIILRIVGERIVARLRSKLFRQTFVQDAEFFDANRVGDLISRLSSDTIIVGKSITQKLIRWSSSWCQRCRWIYVDGIYESEAFQCLGCSAASHWSCCTLLRTSHSKS